MADDSLKPRILVVYYSRTGNTRQVAEAIARATNADIEAIEERVSRRGLLGYLKSGYEARGKKDPVIIAPRRSPSDYDVVLLGSPTWASALASPVRVYLSRFAGRLPAVGFFVTCGGRGAEDVLAQMRRTAMKEPLATLILTERDLVRAAPVMIGEFVNSVLGAWERLSKRVPTSAASRSSQSHSPLGPAREARAAAR